MIYIYILLVPNELEKIFFMLAYFSSLRDLPCREFQNHPNGVMIYIDI